MSQFTLQVQAVLYDNDLEALARSAESIVASAINANALVPGGIEVRLVYGDASPQAQLAPADVDRFTDICEGGCAFSYRAFNENTGFGKGHNLLGLDAPTDFVLVINPDLVFSPHCIDRLVMPLIEDASIGITEGRQDPIEHPKDYDVETGDTDWASGACMCMKTSTFAKLDGFDCETFFMYCEDVDISWRVRGLGLRVVYRPEAFAFHPKRLSPNGQWAPSDNEIRWSTTSGLLMAYKWGNRERFAELEAYYPESPDLRQRAGYADFVALREAGKLPEPIEGAESYTTFTNGEYAKHRFTL